MATVLYLREGYGGDTIAFCSISFLVPRTIDGIWWIGLVEVFSDRYLTEDSGMGAPARVEE